ncbi:HAD family hydrolase [Litorivicinus lipolyticus]|uniref:HAD family hydrolase n=1 Tax=Litorivicinus lipolyticus TaxID=418701 RepID=UPI003B5AC085
MIRAITFDLDDTLWSTADVIGRAEAIMFEWLDEHCPAFTQAHTPDSFVAVRRHFADENPNVSHNLKAVRKLALIDALQQLQVADASRLGAQAAQLFQQARQQVNFFDGALDMLSALSPHYVIGAITNGTTQIAQTAAGEHFQFCLNAEDFAVGKPAAPMFFDALMRLNVPPEQVLHVGDHWDQDVVAAKQLGFQTLWIGQGTPPGPESDHQLAEVRHLPALLGH